MKQIILVCDGSIEELKQTLIEKKTDETLFIGHAVAEVLVDDEERLIIQFTTR